MGRKGMNAVFGALGGVAALGLVTTGAMLTTMDITPSKVSAVQVQTEKPSGDSSSGNMGSDSGAWGRETNPGDESTGTSTSPKPSGRESDQEPSEASGSNSGTNNGDMPTSPGTENPNDGRLTEYVVQRGDTLSSVSQNVGVSVDRLAHANSIDDVNLIYEGSVLVIPPQIADAK